MPRSQMVLIAVAVEGGMVLVGWGLGMMLGTPAFGQLRLTGAAVGYGVLACVPMLLGLAWVVRSRWAPLVRFRETIDRGVAPLFAHCTVLDLAVISALAGIGEEVLFRGVMQTALVGGIGLWPAVALTSVVFGLAHAVTVTYAVYATLVGGYLGVLLIASDNLLVPVVAHGLYDFLALVYLVFYYRPAQPAEGEEGLPGEPE